ncbi:MAG: hypothetical protein SFY81_10310 [Verrucomicrobiota bacterium]|nr:hypothetical protein [Verrucomicrobiota bacterium]
MPDVSFHSLEHPLFPHNAEELRDPQRPPTEHEKEILTIFMRFKEFPDFKSLPPPTIDQKLQAATRLEALLNSTPDPIADQDDHIVELAKIISDHPALFGEVGYYLFSEIMRACKTIEHSEFRRGFLREYLPALPQVREYLKSLAALRRRAKAAKYDQSLVPPGQWGSSERRAAAREQMELVQGLPDNQVMEKYWRMVEIVCSYPDFFTREQFEKVSENNGIEQTWRAHLSKARDDWNYYKNVLNSGRVIRQLVHQAIAILKEVLRNKFPDTGSPN